MGTLDIKDIRAYPTITDGDFTYIMVRKTASQWEIRKIAADCPIAVYNQKRIKDKWTCDCPAGQRGKRCKHATWVGLLEKTGIK